MLKKILALFMQLFLTSCIIPTGVHYYQFKESSQLPAANPDNHLEENKSIVITRISNNILINNPTIEKEWNSLGIGLVNGKISKDTKAETNRFWYINNLFYLKPEAKRYKVFYCDSGQYFLLSIGNIAIVDLDDSGFGLSNRPVLSFTERDNLLGRLKDNQTFTSPKFVVNKYSESLLSSFSADSKEIVYIGDIDLTTSAYGWNKGKINFRILDNYDQAVKEFRANYPQLKNKNISKRLMNPGSLIDAEGDVQFSVPLSETLFGRFKPIKVSNLTTQ